MKKRRKWIILVSVLLFISGLLIWCYFFIPPLKFIYTINPEVSSLPELQQISLDNSTTQDGMYVNIYGYSLSLAGCENAEDVTQRSDDEDPEKSYSTTYKVGEDKLIILLNPDSEDALAYGMRNPIYDDEVIGRSIDAYAGKHLETEFDFYHLLYSASIKDFSFIDNEKNKGLYALLIARSIAMTPNESLYEFDRGDIKGFFKAFDSMGRPSVIAQIYRQTDLNKEYQISFLNFDLKQACVIMSTYKFEE